MTKAFYVPMDELPVPEDQRNFTSKKNLPSYIEKITALNTEAAKQVMVDSIGGADDILSRDMQWQGLSSWMTLRRSPTMPGKLFFTEELAGTLCPDTNFDLCLSINR